MTSGDRTGQNPTLSERREVALDALLSGMTVTAAAEAAGVARQTVHEWLNDPAFAAERNARLQELHDAHRARLHALAGSALAAVERAVEDGDSKLALQLLDRLGFLKPVAIGPISAEEIEEQQAEKEYWSELTKIPGLV